MNIDLNDSKVSTELALKIAQDIDIYCKESMEGGFRNHLGGSLIGHKCSKYLWLVFRWTFKEDFDPRVLRLFDRGHREEDRFINYLEGIGCKVESFDTSKEANENGEYPQFRISFCKGHFGGSLDGIVTLPERYGIKEKVLAEYKTNGTGSAYNKLVASGMRLQKPIHFAQTCTYGAAPEYDFSHVLYMNVNKNDDSLHIEMTKLDHDHGRRMVDKAERIIFSQAAPHRISNNPGYYECAYCAANSVCHKGAIPEKNCRSCKFASPVDNAEWHCGKWNNIIPQDFIKEGCEKWHPITAKG